MSLHNLAGFAVDLGWGLLWLLGTRHPHENQNLIISASGSHSHTHTRTQMRWQIHAHPVDIINAVLSVFSCFSFAMFVISIIGIEWLRLMMTSSSQVEFEMILQERKDMLSTPYASLAGMQELYQTLWKSMSNATDNWQVNHEYLLCLSCSPCSC